MQRVCPRCHESSRHFLCPRCGIRTNDAELPTQTVARYAPDATSANSMSIGGGLFVGLLLSQGLYYGFRHLVGAGILAFEGPAADNEFWASFNGLVVQLSLQVAALFIGGMVAAAGQHHTLMIGAGLGLANAVLIIGLPALAGSPTNDLLLLYGVPVLHVIVGAIAGWLGGRIWQPVPGLPFFGDEAQHPDLLTTAVPDEPEEIEIEPLPWLRIAIGAAVAVGGTLGTRLFRDAVLFAVGGTSGTGSQDAQSSQFFSWGVVVLIQMIGGGIAGTNSRNGAVYGFWVGLLAAGVLTIVQVFTDIRLRAHEILARLLGLTVPENSPAALVIQSVQILVLALIGGWLGSLILPSIPPKRSVNPNEN